MKISGYVFVIISLGILVYTNSLFNGFVWDDEEQVVKNQIVHSITNIPKLFLGSTFNTGGSGELAGLYYKPMMSVFYATLYSLFGANPFFFHSFQLLIHLINSVMVWYLFKYFFDKNMALFISLIFLVHPINTEAVSYIAALQDVLYFCFGIFAWNLFKNVDIGIKQAIAGSLLLLTSLLSKETGVLFVLTIFLFKYFFSRKSLLTYLISASFSVAAYLLLRLGLAGVFFSNTGPSPIMRTDLPERLINIPSILLFYLQTFFAPLNLAIAQHWLVKSIDWPKFYFPLMLVLIFFVVIIGLSVSLTKATQKYLTIFGFFFFWFILGLGLHLQIFPLDMIVAERWFYFPMVGVLGMIGVILTRLFKKQENYFNSPSRQNFVFLIAALIIIALSVRTIVRNFDWRDGLTLYSHDIKISRGAFDLENNLGVELLRAGKLDEAAVHFENSTKLAPHWWTNWNNLGVIVERKQDYQKAKEYYQKAIINGNYYLAYENLASNLLTSEGTKSAIIFTQDALKKLPFNSKLWTVLAIAKYRQSNPSAALNAAKQAYSLSPNQQTYYLYSRISQGLPLNLR